MSADDDYDDWIDDQCYECGGEGFVSDCVEEWACVDPDYGCDYCTRPCPLCNPPKRDPALDKVLSDCPRTCEREVLTTNQQDQPWKGGFDKASWLGRYAEYVMSAGMEHDEAWEWAREAWAASDDDCDPEEAASADLAYSAEDAA